MSYILEALKKSEAERSGAEPGDSGHRVSFASAPGKQREIWPYLLALALTANAAVVAYLVWPESGPGNEALVSGEVATVQRPQPKEEATAKPAPEPNAQEATRAPEAVSTSQPSEASNPVVSEAEPSASSTEPPEPASEAPDREPPDNVTSPARTTESREEVPPIQDMPRSVQQQVPEMTFNGHVWSSRPSCRSVMINNRLLREGARFQGLVIEEITTAGVIFRLDGHLFEIDVVRDWQGGH
ncbi:general secretion pathway protein GspB [Halomonadaceae bacterium KBTZ08]